jgi:endoglucanase
MLNEFYRKTIKAIRSVDKNHIIFVEGNHWAQDLTVLEDFKDDNWVYSIHFYQPIEFTFNLTPHLKYPLISKEGTWDKDTMRRTLDVYRKFAQERGRPIHVGEFGIHYREGLYKEHIYLKDLIKTFNDYGFHWNYWTYKAVKHYMFPDGIYSYYPNPPWVNRVGPLSGWNRWKDLWPEHKKAMTESWRTENFTLNDKVIAQLK